MRTEQGERQWRRHWRECGGEVVLVTKNVGWGSARASSDLADSGDFYPFWKVFQTTSDGKLQGTVDIVKVFESRILEFPVSNKK